MINSETSPATEVVVSESSTTIAPELTEEELVILETEIIKN